MPGMSGLEVAERVRARQPWVPVVIVTGYGSEKSEERAKAAGVSDFLHKPLSPEVIEQTAASALAQGAPRATVQIEEQVLVAAEAEPQAAKKPHLIRNMALFLSAPFIGLLYAVLLPFVGIGMLAYAALKKEKRSQAPVQARPIPQRKSHDKHLHPGRHGEPALPRQRLRRRGRCAGPFAAGLRGPWRHHHASQGGRLVEGGQGVSRLPRQAGSRKGAGERP
jgi:hypothetical protein